ncbi:hypothetical protein E2C01_031905 [Portunus trituberculatus]|uniref:Uncharacterized protein n=1 Tax=Portunus trituberculatus TaxID=210409 RepID=A0A5B7EZF2_PORTR|nr:hypothetical protein [Portunus trituberculatus]
MFGVLDTLHGYGVDVSTRRASFVAIVVVHGRVAVLTSTPHQLAPHLGPSVRRCTYTSLSQGAREEGSGESNIIIWAILSGSLLAGPTPLVVYDGN